MSKKSMWFVAICPACSKRKQLEIQILGSMTGCQFCGKQFKANGLDSFSAALDDPLDYWIEFTDHGLVADDPEVFSDPRLGDPSNPIQRTPR